MATLKPIHSANPDLPLAQGGQPTEQGKLLVENVKRLADRTGGVMFRYMALPSYTVAQLTAFTDAPAFALVGCSDETGGATVAFFDGTNWRRMQDRAIVS